MIDIDIQNINKLFAHVAETQSYSGRGMYGKTCLGVVTSSKTGNFIASILREVENYDIAIETLAYVIDRMCQDNLGYDTVYYFPGVPFVGDEQDDDESEDE